ncbi:Hypothetical protein LUCI_4367 [Lucifera butyrica]|uniref:HD domain-containing protein n=1 Tax=Lucifera butyrica TaxID=1351585 RepID=A0A498RCF2_9FIRM|nr:HD domain-containing protein [Lucifera butyrica]VBB09081.1 Hypothetical protein LUCI_4367 [Lucifera butyrica]
MNRIFEMQRKMLRKIAEFQNKAMERDQPLDWERVHMISCAKIGEMLALKRGADTEMAAIACSVHDYGRILTGKQKNHAVAGYEPLLLFLTQCGCFAPDEVELIARAAKKHSNKSEVGTPVEEIVKDADVLDCYQYGLPIEREEQRLRLTKVLAEISG